MVSIRRCRLVLHIQSVLRCTDCFILCIVLHCSKLHKVDQWLEEYVGREELLYSKLVKKYTPHRALSPERHSSDNAITSNNSNNNNNNYSYSNDNAGATTAGAGRADGGTGAYNTDYNNDYNNDNYSEAIDYYEQEDADEKQYGQQYGQQYTQQQQQQRPQPETPGTAQQSQFNGNSMMSPATPVTPANPWAQFEQVCSRCMLACLYLGVHSVMYVHQRVTETVAARCSSAGSCGCALARQLLLCLYCSKHKHLVRVVYLCIMRRAQS
jgi:hypothetical protein